MDLNYIKSYLINIVDSSDKFYDFKIKELIEAIEKFQEEEKTCADVSSMLRTVNEYNLDYLTLATDFRALPSVQVKKRIDKAQEILCVLSSVHTYLFHVLTRYNSEETTPAGLWKHVRTLGEKKEYYKSEKYTWVTILKSLTQQSNQMVELAKMKIYSGLDKNI